MSPAVPAIIPNWRLALDRFDWLSLEESLLDNARQEKNVAGLTSQDPEGTQSSRHSLRLARQVTDKLQTAVRPPLTTRQPSDPQQSPKNDLGTLEIFPEQLFQALRKVRPAQAEPPRPTISLQPLQEWEGYVIGISESIFAGRLTDVTAGRNLESEVAEFPIADLAEDDQQLLVPGAVFRWVIGYLRYTRGTKVRVSQITFRRLPVWTKRDLLEAKRQAEAAVSRVPWE